MSQGNLITILKIIKSHKKISWNLLRFKKHKISSYNGKKHEISQGHLIRVKKHEISQADLKRKLCSKMHELSQGHLKRKSMQPKAGNLIRIYHNGPKMSMKIPPENFEEQRPTKHEVT